MVNERSAWTPATSRTRMPDAVGGQSDPAQEGRTMEYLVTMTTDVPPGTSAATVEDIRTREAGHSRELAPHGHLLRLWRPPLGPGEWRSLGLFAAAGSEELENVLASMPLRVWRTDEVTPLAPHPNDPAARRPDHPDTSAGQATGEFLTSFTITVPAGTPAETVEDTTTREAQRAHELAAQGHLRRLWSPPTEPRQWRTLGLS